MATHGCIACEKCGRCPLCGNCSCEKDVEIKALKAEIVKLKELFGVF